MNTLLNNFFLLITDVVDWDSTKIEQSKDVAFNYSWTFDLACIDNMTIRVTEESRWLASQNSVCLTKVDREIKKGIYNVNSRRELVGSEVQVNGGIQRDGVPTLRDGSRLGDRALAPRNVVLAPGDGALASKDKATVSKNEALRLENGPVLGDNRFEDREPDYSFPSNAFERASFLALRL